MEADDDIVPVTESRRITEAMKQFGAEVRYNRSIQMIGHPCWNKAYEEPNVISMASL